MINNKLSNFYSQCVRVWQITKKPNKDEYIATVKVSLMGVFVIGMLGFIIFLVKQYITM